MRLRAVVSLSFTHRGSARKLTLANHTYWYQIAAAPGPSQVMQPRLPHQKNQKEPQGPAPLPLLPGGEQLPVGGLARHVEEDPMDAAIALVLEIVPDVQPEHVSKLIQEHLEAYGVTKVHEPVLHALFEDPSYPKVKIPFK